MVSFVGLKKIVVSTCCPLGRQYVQFFDALADGEEELCLKLS